MKYNIDNRVGNPDKDFIPLYMRIGLLPQSLHHHIRYDYDLDRRGIEHALHAVAQDFNEKNNGNITEANIVLTSGARAAASSAILHVMMKEQITNRKVLLVQPGYNLYQTQFEGFGFKCEFVNLQNAASDEEKLERIRRSLTGETLFLPLCNPNNPTGEVYSETFLRGILKLVDDFPHLHVVNDSIYDMILRSEETPMPNIFSFASDAQRKKVFEINALSKYYSYPGIRAGWLISDAEEIAKMQGVKDAQFGPLTNISQILIIAALEQTPMRIPDYFEQVNAVYNARLQLVHDKLHQIKGFDSKIPDGTFYYWADFGNVKGITAQEIIKEAEQRGILLSNGAKFGAPNCMRINCGAKASELAVICDNIVDICREKGVEVNLSDIHPPTPEDDLPSFSKDLLKGR